MVFMSRFEHITTSTATAINKDKDLFFSESTDYVQNSRVQEIATQEQYLYFRTKI